MLQIENFDTLNQSVFQSEFYDYVYWSVYTNKSHTIFTFFLAKNYVFASRTTSKHLFTPSDFSFRGFWKKIEK